MTKKRSKRRSVRVSVTLPHGVLKEINEIIREGRYVSRSALVAEAVRRLLEREAGAREQLKRKLKQEWEG